VSLYSRHCTFFTHALLDGEDGQTVALSLCARCGASWAWGNGHCAPLCQGRHVALLPWSVEVSR
jgi:hypothetical protein